MCVRWGGTLSVPFNVSNGVKQGGILSPYLFNVYMDELTSLLNKCNTGCILGSMSVNHLMYADDLVLMSPSVTGLQDLIGVCEQFGAEHDILYNPKKSAILIFRNMFMKNVASPLFSISGKNISEVSHVKYLGHYISNDLKDDKDIMRQCRQLYAQGNMLIRKFYMCSNQVKTTLFRTFCTSLYTSQLWWNFTKGSINKLYVAYNNVFRMMHKLPRDCSASGMFVNSQVNNCPAVLRNLTFRFMSRLDASTNMLIQSILHSDLKWKSRIRNYWVKVLYVHHGVT